MAFVPLSPAHSETSVFQPLSPAHSETNVFQPLSPAHSIQAYEPQSPRTKPLSFLEKILYDMNNNKPFTHKPKKYQSISDWQSYCRHMIMNERKEYNYTTRVHECKLDNLSHELKIIFVKRRVVNMYRKVFNTWLGQSESKNVPMLDTEYIQHSHEIVEKLKADIRFRVKQLMETQKRLVTIRFTEICQRENIKLMTEYINEWKKVCPTPRQPIKEPINVPNDPYHIFTNLTVREDGTIGVKMSAPLAHIYDKYHKNFTNPPHEEYMEALKEFGYPQWFIDKANKRFAKREPRETPTCTLMESLDKYSKIKKPKAKVKSSLNKFKS